MRSLVEVATSLLIEVTETVVREGVTVTSLDVIELSDCEEHVCPFRCEK